MYCFYFDKQNINQEMNTEGSPVCTEGSGVHLIHFRGKCALYRVKVCHIRTSLKNIL